MAIDQTFTVTVVGGKYYINGVQQDTVMIGAGLTYKFDQSDSSNGNHPLRFSTTSNGTHAGGTEYTAGVTTSGVPGNAGAYTQIDVQSGAPSTLYYYCSNHSGMGGQANTDGWGRSNFGQADWGDTNLILSGWGRLGWGEEAYGDSPNVVLTGQFAVSEIGSLTESIIVQPGWGTLDYGENGWGSVESAVENLIAPSALTSSVGAVIPEDVVGLTGQSATASTIVQFDIPEQLLGLSMTAAEGQLDINAGADQTIGLASFVGTTSVGSLSPADVMGLSGIESTSGVGSISIDSVDIIDVTGQVATTEVGALTTTEMSIGLTGVSATSSVGAITPTEITMGLTGVAATAEIGITGFGTIAYKDIDITGNTSYTSITHVA